MKKKEKSLFDSPHKRWAAKQVLYKSLLDELHGHFLSMCVKYMPLKGAFLILSGLSGKIDSREMVDVDLLVEKTDFEKVKRYFEACPAAELKSDEWYFEQPFFYRFGSLSILVEIHYEINRPERFLLPADALFSRAEKIRGCLFFPSLEDALAIEVCHSVVHIAYGGFRFELLRDIEVISESAGFSWQRFDAVIRNTGIKRYVEFVFIVYHLTRGKEIGPDGFKRPFILQLMARLFVRRYGSMSGFFQRVFFELPFIRRPLKLVFINLFK